MTALDVLGLALAGLGAVLFVVAALGLVRFPDVFSRISAVTKAATLGVCLVLLGVLALEPSWRTAVAVFVAITLQVATSPVGGFALGRSAYRAGSPMAPGSRYDELGDQLRKAHSESLTGTNGEGSSPETGPVP